MNQISLTVESELLTHRLEQLVLGHPTRSNRDSVSITAFDSALGSLMAGANDDAVLFLEFTDSDSLEERLRRLQSATDAQLVARRSPIFDHLRGELDSYFSGDLRIFSTPVKLLGTPFQMSVWSALLEIEYGTTVSYLDLAERLGCPDAVRAVAGANGRNRLAILVPCHRVIGRNGKLTGYAGGLDRKRKLLDLEAEAVGRPVQSSLF